ncbi:MAG: hypothetical protein U9R75_11555 [Candidatus Thermoplasmatota archaeon]|nr:hypothetical protein [Candidatus Thermoplasmatota archaeon]
MGLKVGERSPLFITFLVMILGGALLACVVLNLPVKHSPDVDDDGVSDLFQNIEEDRELVKDGDEWRNVVVGRSSETNFPAVSLFGFLLLFVFPVLTYTYIWQRPIRRRRSMERLEESRMLDLVRRIASFLEIDPSLQGALRNTQSSLPDDQQDILGPLAWEPMTRGVSFGSVYGDFTEKWTDRSQLIGGALRSLGASAREKDRENISSSVRRTMLSFDKGCREMIQEYARSLSGPSTVLFALGVLLPLMLATMIPLTGLSDSSLIMVGFLLWVIVPFGILFYGKGLVERRPMQDITVRKKDDNGYDLSIKTLFLISAGILFLAATVLFNIGVLEMNSVPLDRPSIIVLGVLLSISFLSAGVIAIQTGSNVRTLEFDMRNRAISHSLLREIGTNLEENRSFESSVRRAVARENSRGSTMDPPLPGDLGYIARLPSPLDHLLSSVKHFSKAGSRAGAGAVKALAGHLEEMHSMERDLASRVRSSIGQMGITASVFAPLMIGSSVGIFRLMERSGSSTTSGMMGGSMGSGMAVHHFMILSGGYLLMLGIATTLTLYRLETGKAKGGWHKVPKALVLSSFSFTISTLMSTYLIG